MSTRDQKTDKNSMLKSEILTEKLRAKTPWNNGQYMTREAKEEQRGHAEKTKPQ